MKAPNVEILVHEGDGGRVLYAVQDHNLVTNVGLTCLVGLLAHSTTSNDAKWVNDGGTVFIKTPRYIAVGTGAVAPAAGDTALGAEVLRKLIVRRYPLTHGIEWYGFLSTAEGNGSSLTEAGLFCESATGSLLARVTHVAIVKTVLFSVSYKWTWTFGNG